MERELTRRCRHIVRIAEFVNVKTTNTIRTGYDARVSLGHTIPLFAGNVEVLYARSVWLAVRIDIWSSNDSCYCQVKALSVYLQHNKDQRKVAVTNGSALNAMQEAQKLALSAKNWDEGAALTSEELLNVLDDVVKQVILAFQEQQVQELKAAASQRAKFEFEMLQHSSDLEILMLNCGESGLVVLIALPLMEEKNQWNPKVLIETEEEVDLVYIPDGFGSPNFSDATENGVFLIGYPIRDEVKFEGAWPFLVEWPERMILSSQVTHIPTSSKAQSSIELITSCREMFLHQWTRRKEFIAELRRHVIVLEYDALDFARVFFVLQEQLNEQAPLRIIVLKLHFPAKYFSTNCMSDLQLTLLDGNASAEPVTIALSASSITSDFDPALESKACVFQFLEYVRQSLLYKFYED
ncbi:uncharacterized protein PHALS_11560 [Plasmopara halstedii]|uniref:Uncharacterized protein n=1 Tax=Plasmopara halstedii TaxID=4781 RepID=A0A0P1AK41_PLAHL|nr:uncharacterized protein PHALS_11560 [Plasmopara halstedii]CEG41197.1 hypothetical protein PHALS_11560 [Plasmopara halstedii]|eukprot:XP_024577566.1 hypothetical protein PHALS_11560 [Plasmopara halstedii]